MRSLLPPPMAGGQRGAGGLAFSYVVVARRRFVRLSLADAAAACDLSAGCVRAWRGRGAAVGVGAEYDSQPDLYLGPTSRSRARCWRR